jgi:hypothetical protein
VKGTGVYATKGELAAIIKAAAKIPPVIAIGIAGPHSLDPFAEPRRRLWEKVHRAALRHGLPEIPGFYGIIPGGEFVTADPPTKEESP